MNADNEQLLVSLEETASSTEEVETLNEEMQATNEELETLNEELQATVEELNTTNDELEARGRDLEEAERTRESSLRESERLRQGLIAALQALEQPFALFSAEGNLHFSNRALDEVLSNVSIACDGSVLPLDEAWSKLARPDQRQDLIATLRDSSGAETTYQANVRKLEFDGTAYWMLTLRR